MIVLYIDSTPLVVGGAANGAVWVTATEGEFRPATIVPEEVGSGEEYADGTAVVVLLFGIA
jgi:hypothetical protein